MAEIRIRKRRRLRNKDIKSISEDITKVLDVDVFTDGDTVDLAESSDYELLFVNGKILGIIYDGKPFLTIRGVLTYRPKNRWVTVDMGAVPYVTKGADIMAPGIVDADLTICQGDLVWIRDEKNKVALAIGKSLMDGEDLILKDEGKSILNIHHVGDRLWKLEEP